MTFTYNLDTRELNGAQVPLDERALPPTLASLTRAIESEHGPITRWERPASERVVVARTIDS